jgi:hypothetical protein
VTSPDGVRVDPNKLLQRAYARIAELTLENDKLVILVEDLQNQPQPAPTVVEAPQP